jgi:hypothetical protein
MPGGDQPVGIGPNLPGLLRDPDRHRDRDVRAGAALSIAAAHIEHPSRDDAAFAQGRRRRDNAELVTAGARQKVAGPQPGLHHEGEMLQAGSAGGVAVSVVDTL